MTRAIIASVDIPTIVLMKFSTENRLGPLWGLIVALIFPIGYGIYDLVTRKKTNVLSILGFVSVLCSGGLALAKVGGRVKGAVKIIARLTYRQRYAQSTGRDPFRCPHCGKEMAVWRIWHPTYGVIYDEGELIKRGTYASTVQRAGPWRPTDVSQVRP